MEGALNNKHQKYVKNVTIPLASNVYIHRMLKYQILFVKLFFVLK